MTFVTCVGAESLNKTTAPVQNYASEAITRVAARLPVLRIDHHFHNSRWTPVLGRLAGGVGQQCRHMRNWNQDSPVRIHPGQCLLHRDQRQQSQDLAAGTTLIVHPSKPHPSGRHSAIRRLSANGHSLSIHCSRQENPDARAISGTSALEYLWLLSVQMVSPSSNSTCRFAA